MSICDVNCLLSVSVFISEYNSDTERLSLNFMLLWHNLDSVVIFILQMPEVNMDIITAYQSLCNRLWDEKAKTRKSKEIVQRSSNSQLAGISLLLLLTCEAEMRPITFYHVNVAINSGNRMWLCCGRGARDPMQALDALTCHNEWTPVHNSFKLSINRSTTKALLNRKFCPVNIWKNTVIYIRFYELSPFLFVLRF